MVIADIIALLVVMGLGGFVGKSVFSLWSRARERHHERMTEQEKMRADLRAALATHDKRALEDFLVIWGDEILPVARELVKRRIDELFIEEDNKEAQ